MSTFTVLSLVYISLINLLYGQPINTYINSITIITSLLRTSKVYSLSSDCNDGSCAALGTAEKQAILDIHNELRDRTAGGGLPGHPAATDMNYLIWDDGLANVAQTYAESCPGLNHNGNRGIEYLSQRDAGNVKWGPDTQYRSNACSNQNCISIGENLAVRSSPYTVSNIVSQIESGWYDEWQEWSYGNHNSGCSGVCGHYTQMVWANTRYVGCGYSNGCSSGGWASVFLCNYFPAGNFNSIPPYTSGTACSNCMSDRTQCKSEYITRSDNALSYPSQPYNALCDGGACPTMCDGGSYSRSNCDGTGCNNNNIDCNDGTINKNNGRNICATDSPTSPTNNPITQQPTQPTTTTLPPTKAPISGPPPCLMLSNYEFSNFNGRWDYDNEYDSQPSYRHDSGSYYLAYISAWGYNALHASPKGQTTIYGYCNQNDIWNCGVNTWYYYADVPTNDGFSLDSDAAMAPCPTASTTKSPTKSPTTKPPTASPTPNTPSPTFNTATPTSNTIDPTKTPSLNPTIKPTISPTNNPTLKPTQNPLVPGSPTTAPSDSTLSPSKTPSKFPTKIPSSTPSKTPTKTPSKIPTLSPSKTPTKTPTNIPTKNPITSSPTKQGETRSPSFNPSISPSKSPTTTLSPTKNPTQTRPPTTCDGWLSTNDQIFIIYTIHWSNGKVDIEFRCPISHWCGVGFDATQMSDNPYALILSSDPKIDDVQLISHQYSAPLSNKKILNSELLINTETIASITIPITASNAFDYNKIISNNNKMNMIWAISSNTNSIWQFGTSHISKGSIIINCKENTFNPTNTPITLQPTNTPIISIKPTKRPTYRPWYQCLKNGNIFRKCKYQIKVDINIEFTYDTNNNINGDIMIQIIESEIANKWSDLVNDGDNIDITISINNNNNNGIGHIEIIIMIGVENDNIYNGHFTTKGDNGAIENGLKSVLIDNGYNIGITYSNFTLIELLIETTNNEADEINVNGKSGNGSVMFDFSNYGAIDWLLFSVILLIIIIVIILCIFCIIKYAKNKKYRETSRMGVSTGIYQSELTSISSYKKTRPKAIISFGSTNELPKQNNLAFNAAIHGVALIKTDTNVDLISEGQIEQTHIIAAIDHDTSPENTPIIQPKNDFNHAELIALSDAILDDKDGNIGETINNDIILPQQTDNYQVVNTTVNHDEEYEYEYEYEQPEIENEPEQVVVIPPPVPAAAIPPPVPTEIKNKYKKTQKKEEIISIVDVVPPIVPYVIQQPEPEPEPIVETVLEEEIEYLSIDEAKNQTGIDKEKYLNDIDFENVFGMNKDSFNGLPKWKQKNLKKSKGFF